MTRRPWFEVHEAAARRRAARLAGPNLIQVEFTVELARDEGGKLVVGADPHVWREDWAPPPLDRSVHMRPAETSHSGRDSAVFRSLRWLLDKAGFGGPLG